MGDRKQPSPPPSEGGPRQAKPAPPPAPPPKLRAHVVGCRSALSVPVDRCQCGGRDVEFADRMARDMFRAERDDAVRELAAVRALWDKTSASLTALQNGVRSHRDQRGDDRCWLDDETLYALLPEGYAPPARDAAVEFRNCERFIATRRNPKTEYVSPQREIERLTASFAELEAVVARFGKSRTAFVGGLRRFWHCLSCEVGQVTIEDSAGPRVIACGCGKIFFERETKK